MEEYTFLWMQFHLFFFTYFGFLYKFFVSTKEEFFVSIDLWWRKQWGHSLCVEQLWRIFGHFRSEGNRKDFYHDGKRKQGTSFVLGKCCTSISWMFMNLILQNIDNVGFLGDFKLLEMVHWYFRFDLWFFSICHSRSAYKQYVMNFKSF